MLCTTIHDACTNKGNLWASCVRFTASLVYDCARPNNGEGKRVHRDSRGLPMMTNRSTSLSPGLTSSCVQWQQAHLAVVWCVRRLQTEQTCSRGAGELWNSQRRCAVAQKKGITGTKSKNLCDSIILELLDWTKNFPDEISHTNYDRIYEEYIF